MAAETGGAAIRQRVIYSGHVQGVCFRAISQETARRYQVVGYVRNLTDGTVELEAEGAPAEVVRYLAAVETEFEHHITGAARSTLPARGDESRFEIRY